MAFRYSYCRTSVLRLVFHQSQSHGWPDHEREVRSNRTPHGVILRLEVCVSARGRAITRLLIPIAARNSSGWAR